MNAMHFRALFETLKKPVKTCIGAETPAVQWEGTSSHPDLTSGALRHYGLLNMSVALHSIYRIFISRLSLHCWSIAKEQHSRTFPTKRYRER